MTRREMIEMIAETIRGVRKDNRNTEPGVDLVAWAFADKLYTTDEEKDFFFNQTVDGVVKRPRTA